MAGILLHDDHMLIYACVSATSDVAVSGDNVQSQQGGECSAAGVNGLIYSASRDSAINVWDAQACLVFLSALTCQQGYVNIHQNACPPPMPGRLIDLIASEMEWSSS